jgi:hypothetical protein
MTLVEAVAPSFTQPSTSTLPRAAAHMLLFRLTRLVTDLIHISNFGIRTLPKPKPTPQTPDHPTPPARPSQPPRPAATPSLPRRRGWLLAALPEIAPPIAAEISTLLADPAIASLLDLAPSLRRNLRPLLRALGLDAPTPIPTPPRPPSVGSGTLPHPTITPAPAPAPAAAPRPVSKLALPTPQPSHALFVTIS